MSAELGYWRYTVLRQTGSLSAESGRMPDFQVLINPGIAAFYFRSMFEGTRGLNTLPQRLRQYLLDQPETTNDLHVVSVILKDGRVFEDVAISHCSLVAAVRGHSHVPFDAQDIAELRVTHRRWGFGQEIKPS